MNSIVSPVLSGVDQIGLVVHSLEPWLERYVAMGIGPWWVGTYAPPRLTDTRVRGRDVAYSMRLALSWIGDTQWELIEPLDGPSIYKEHLASHGEGFHHVQLSYDSPSYPEFEKTMVRKDCSVLMEGRFGGARFAYFDTFDALGLIVEVRDAPENYVRPEPDFWYPADTEGTAFGR